MNKALIVSDKKKILLRDSHPSRITTVIPTSKMVNYKGTDLVVVPHELDETAVLNNMGYDIQSPIQTYYHWPSRYPKPMHAQSVTAGNLTLSKRHFVLNDLGCVDSETEYLSPSGWRKISEYAGGGVAQYWPETGKSDFVFDPEFVKLPCETMIRIKTKYGVDQLLSPEHRILLRDSSGSGKSEVLQAVELLVRQGQWQSGETKKSLSKIGFSKAAIPAAFDGRGGIGLALTDIELRVQIAVVADAHFPNQTNRCVVRLKRQRKKDRLRDLLSKAGISWKERSVDTRTAAGFTVFSFQAPLRKKVFGQWAWDMTPDQLRVVCDEVMHWDGSVSDDKPTTRFSTSEKESADFVQYAYCSTGRVARVISTQRNRNGITSTEYEVSVRDSGKPLMLAGTKQGGEKTTPMSIVASTDGFKYCFMVPSTFLVLRRNGCVFCTGNTGKTLSALWAFDYLRSQGRAKRMVVVTPLSTMESVWANEVWEHLPHLQTQVLYGTAKRRVAQLEFPADIYIINHDGLKVPEILAALLARKDIDVLCVDELADFKNAATDRFKALRQLSGGRTFFWGMTGTPIPNKVTDAWAQCRLINPSRVPPYFGKFRDMVMRHISQFKWVPRENALEVVREAMQPATLFRRDECVDLPPTMYETRHVEMTEEQKKAYKQMLNSLVAEVGTGQLVAVNEAVKMGKLLQISLGCGYGQDGEVLHIKSESRIEELKRLIEASQGKVIVFIPLTGGLHSVADAIKDEWQTEVVYGDVSKSERDRIFGEFKQPGGLHVIVAHPKCMSHGLTLVTANTIIWFIPTNNPNDYTQANGRITRPGQTRSTFIIHLEGSEVERRMYRRLKEKGQVQGVLLDMIKDGIDS